MTKYPNKPKPMHMSMSREEYERESRRADRCVFLFLFAMSPFFALLMYVLITRMLIACR